ncbi:MarR family transcriptional regulator [Streptomyces sp. SDr-06]|nr:MarR family transcriptional regulator [Streptomyces sp. SDr-06]
MGSCICINGSDGHVDRAGSSDDPLDCCARQVAEAAEALVTTWTAAVQNVVPRLSVMQLEALRIVSQAPGLNLTSFADLVGATAPTASRLCDRLEAAGLLRRERAPANRREVGLSLTLQGQELWASISEQRSLAMRRVLQGVPAAQREALLAGLGAFAAAVKDGRGKGGSAREP